MPHQSITVSPAKSGVDFVIDPGNRHPGVTADLAPFGFARKGAEALPTAYHSYAGWGQILKPVFHARMRLGAMLHSVVTGQKVHEPGIGFLLILWHVKVVEGFVHLLYLSLIHI